ncbi:MAG: lasso peptide biosynthesis B2 protein [Eubacteriales bacterium]|nr:lasso peptide biosynthesis B2 protein [Eubacteriales bacterium]
MSLAKKINRFLRLTPGQKRLLAEAFAMLGVSRLALLLLPFKRFAPLLGKPVEDAYVADAQQMDIAKKVGWAVRAASMHTPWQSKCLAQAMTAKHMLNRRKIHNTMYLGLARDDSGKMIAHAWVFYCGLPLTGATDTQEYTVVSTFSS